MHRSEPEWFVALFGVNGKPVAAVWSTNRQAAADRARELGAVQAYARSPKGDRETWTRSLDGGWSRVRRESAEALGEG